MFLTIVICYKDKYIIICSGDAAAYRAVYVCVVSLAERRPTSLQRIQHKHIHTIYCCITGIYKKLFIVLTYNFSKEQYVLPEDDLRIETCRRLLNVLL